MTATAAVSSPPWGSSTADDDLPPHGTYARANGRFYADIPPCPCGPCRHAEFLYDKQRRVDIAAGRIRVMNAEEIRAEIERLAAAGMTYLDIARAARCSKATIANARQPGARVTARVAGRITAVRATHSAQKPVPAFGAVRRIRAALAVGHVQSVFAAAADLSVSYISELANGRVTTVRADTHDRIAAAYEILLTRPDPAGAGATRARRRAAAHGWPTPQQWDGEIDNPDADPAAWVRSNGRHRSEDLAEDVEFAVRTTGVDLDLVAERFGVSRNRLEKARERTAKRARTAARQAVAA